MRIFNTFLFLILFLFSHFAFPIDVVSSSRPPKITRIISGSGTFTPSAGCKWIRVRMVGPGGGGAGSARGSINDAGNGANGSGNTTYGLSIAQPGYGGLKGLADGSSGGGGTVGSDAYSGFVLIGQISGGGGQGFSHIGAYGGSAAFFGGGGAAGAGQRPGYGGIANTGGGGGSGGGTAEASASYTGSGGGPGGYVEAIYKPCLPKAYSIGVGGNGGTAGTGPGYAGGRGADGGILVEENF